MNGQPNGNSCKRTLVWLWISLALIVVGDIGAHLIQTDGGNIQVTGIKLPTENGQRVTADLFKPQTATEETKAPMVVVCPGFERSKETMTSYSIELARRGIAVITIDPYSQGASSSSAQRRSATKEGYGVVPMVEYICDTPNFNYVDKTKIGVAGYSAGGNAVLQSASLFGAREKKALRKTLGRNSEEGRTPSEAELARAHSENKIEAVFIGGYVLTLSNGVLANVDANIGMDYARHDEGAYRNKYKSADMRYAAESLSLVNSALPEDEQVTNVEIGKIYGNPTNRTLRVVHNTSSIHPFMPYNTTHVGNMVDFFTTVFAVATDIPSSNQIWPYKELFTLMSLTGAFLFLVPFASLMLRLPLFNALVHPIPPPLPKTGKQGRILFWITFAFSASLACYLFIPATEATATLFPEASTDQLTWWFPERMNNAILLWAVANGLVGLLIFSLTYKLFGKKRGVTPAMWGINTNIKELARTFFLAFIVFASFYALLFISYDFFHTDFRFIFVSAPAAFAAKLPLVSLEYIPLFFIFFLANSIRVNSASRVDGLKNWAHILINAIGNSLGLALILAIQYVSLASTGTVFWTQGWLYVNLLLGVIPMMFILPIFNRAFFRLTGTVYLGPMVTCLIFIMMLLSSNICYIPLD